MLASAALPTLTGEWKQYSFTMKTGETAGRSANNQILVSVAHPGTVWMQLFSLFPPTYKNRANGNRVDLMEMMAAMHPKFLRFPGGNYLEGDRINERFDWKKTIGPLVDRPGHREPVELSLDRRAGTAGVSGVVRGPEDAAGAGGVRGLLAAAGAREAGRRTWSRMCRTRWTRLNM